MNEIITRGTILINKMLEEPDDHLQYPDEESHLIAFRDCLNNMSDYDSTTTDWSRLFFRRLTRLLNYNETIPFLMCYGLNNDLLCVLNKKNADKDSFYFTDFLKKMELEGKLEQREIQFKKIYGERKSLERLVEIHRNLLGEYLQTCISFHSTLQVPGLIENVNDLLYNCFQQKNIIFSSHSKERLETRLKHIEIPLEFSHRSLQSLRSTFSSSTKAHDIDDTNENSFFPWIEQLQYEKNCEKKSIEDCLKEHRWLVILGDPGSAKTSLLRWIMLIFSKAILGGDKRILIDGTDWGPVRIPILIRIGEFVQWCEQHPTSTLMDYIGKHTWFSHPYSFNDTGNMLKEFIAHGHTLILLDGLDEISIFEKRRETVKLVQEFIDQYVQSPDFFSISDNIIDRGFHSSDDVYDTQLPTINGGNQVIVTSRIVGYYLHRLRGPLIMHFLLSPMNTNQKKEFAENWFRRVNYETQQILKSEGIETNSQNIEILQMREKNIIDKVSRNEIEQLSSHPLTFSLICSFVFAISDDFALPEFRIGLYDLTVQSTIRIWINQQSILSEDVIIQFLNELAFYIHLNSSSGLIDEFDMKQLCYFSLKQQRLLNNRIKLRQYTNELVALLDSNVGIIAERGLQVFSFVHLSFQEYFVARYFAKHCSIDEATHRFLTFATNSRFREPLLLALGWISWKWSFIDYDAFCSMLVTKSTDYVIPLGALLLFEAMNDLKILPSKEVIFKALNNILDHSSHLISAKYLRISLSKLEENMIVEWMQLNLVNENRVCCFCKCLLSIFVPPEHRKPQWIDPKWVSSLICQQLQLFNTKSSSTEFIIDETLRQIASSQNKFHLVSKDGLSEYLISHSIPASNIHPLILSVIIALCHGIHMINDKFDFWSNLTYRNPLILDPFIDYFSNTDESHATKVQKLIDHYEFTLRNTLHTDISNDIIDTFVVLICLRGVSNPSLYQEFHAYQALILAVNQFKRILFHLRSSYNESYIWMKNKSSLFSDVERIINTFLFQSTQSNRYPLAFSLAFTSVWLRLGLWQILYNSKFDVSFERNMTEFLESDIKFDCFIKYFYVVSCNNNLIVDTDLDRIATGTYLLHISRKKTFFLLFFVPKGLELLYYQLCIASNNTTDSLPFVVLLAQCLIFLDGIDRCDANFFSALSVLLPLLKENGLENYALAFLWEDSSDDQDDIQTRQVSFNQFDIYLSKTLETHIDEERKRIQTIADEAQNINADLNYFVASISLARIFQAQYRVTNSQAQMEGIDTIISANDSKEIFDNITKIDDLTLRIIALSIVLNLKDPFVFDQVQSEILRQQIIVLLERLLPTLPLLVSTFLFVRCQSMHDMYPLAFDQFGQIIGEHLVTVPSDETAFQAHEAAYIALRMLHNPSLALFLSQFEKQTMHMTDLFELNSTIFHRYFIDTLSFDSMNTVLLSSMYLSELSLDVQILNKHYHYHINSPETISLFKELKDLLTESNDVITLEIAVLITYSLKISDEKDIIDITNKISRCFTFQTNAKSMILKWLNYQTDGPWGFFAYYASLLLAKEGIIFPLVIDRIDELCNIGIDHKFSCIIRALLEIHSVNSMLLNHILTSIIRSAHRSSLKTEAIISSNEIMTLILELEQDQLSSDELGYKSFLTVIDGCSLELQDYLVEHLRKIINSQTLTQITVKEKYISIIVTWFIRNSCSKTTDDISNKLYDCIFELLYDQRFPRIQKKIVDSLKIVFDDDKSESAFKTKQIQTNIENLICSCLNSLDICANDLLSICLLAYGNCILYFRREKEDGSIPSEMYNSLNILFKTSSSPIISTRAGLCLFFCNSNTNHISLLDWLNEEMNVTYEKAYDVLIQRMLLNPSNWIISDSFWVAYIQDDQQAANPSTNDLFKLMKTYPEELLAKFVNEMYNYLQNQNNNNQVIKQTPNYIDLTEGFIQENLDIFRKIVQKSFFGQEKFQKAIYEASKRGDERQFSKCLRIYAIFEKITVDLIDMFGSTQFENDGTKESVWKDFKNLKKITSNREAIEKLFTEIGSLSEHFLVTKLFVYLVQNDMLPRCELHRQILLAINNRSYQNIDEHRNKYEDLCQFLLSISSVQTNVDKLEQPIKLLTDHQINKTFENVRWTFS